jgi:hypothetical protein
MPAITVGYPEFEARLLRIRRRVNRSSLVDALCTIGAALLLAGASTTTAGFVFSGQPLAWTHRVIVLIAVAVICATGWRLRHSWLDLEGTAVHVDRLAGMHARLATMLAHPNSNARSELRPILLWQIFDRSPQWEIQHIAPRRIRRPGIAFAIALVAFSLAQFLQPTPDPRPPTEIAKNSASSSTAANRVHRRTGQATSRRQTSALLQAGGNSKTEPGGDRTAGDSSSELSPDPSDGRGADQAGNGGAGSGMDGDRRQHSAVAGTPPSVPPVDSPGDGARLAEETRQPDGARAGPAAAQRSGDGKSAPGEATPRQGEGAERSATARRDGSAPPTAGKSGNTGGGSRATARGTPDAERAAGRAVLGKAGRSPLRSQEKAEPMVIRLQAFTAGPARSEPQSGRSNVAGDGTAPDDPSPLVADQIDDSVLLRSHVARHHQALVRQLFTPDQE